MPSTEEIKKQQTLLATYRQTLAIQLNQLAQLGAAYTPPGTIIGIMDARNQIIRIKGVLRSWHVETLNHPDDEEASALPIAEQLAQPTSTPIQTFIFHGPIHSGSTQFGGKQHIGEAKIAMGDSFDFSGANLSGSNNNFKSTLVNVTQSVGALPNASADQKQQIEQLLTALGVELEKVPAENKEDAKAVEEMAKELLEKAAKAKPNKSMVTISAEGLKQAAQNIASVLPTVLPIATQIATQILATIHL